MSYRQRSFEQMPKSCGTEFIRELAGAVYLKDRVDPFANEFAPTETEFAAHIEYEP